MINTQWNGSAPLMQWEEIELNISHAKLFLLLLPNCSETATVFAVTDENQ